MPTFEERLTLLENEQTKLKKDNTELKKTIELQTIAIGALVNKTMLERLNERYDKLFESLIAHDQFTNTQLSELRTQQVELDGKLAGLQTEVRQGFNELRTQQVELDGKLAGLQTEIRQGFNTVNTRFEQVENTLAQILARLPENP